MASASPAPNAPSKAGVVPSEVGWQFVSQYYICANKQPHRLHSFYTENSTYIHGVEGQDSPACHGLQEIQNKILSIGFQDCKIFINNLDAQSSAASGIIVQVIGEMSNARGAWRKFVQTFFLAEQPNGYFILNDIFRYLREETSDVDSTEPTAPESVSAPQLHDAAEVQPEPEPVVSLPPSAPQETAVPKVAPEPPEPAKETTRPPSPSPEPEPVQEPTPIGLSPAREPTPSPAAPAATAATPAPATEKPQAPAAASAAPKNWVNVAVTNMARWGQAPFDARGVSTAPKSTTRAPEPAPTAPARKEEPPVDMSSLSPQAQAAMTVTTAQCYVKLNDWVRNNPPGGTPVSSNAGSVSPTALKDVLTSRFGAVKELEVVRTKACAFMEFVSVDSARRAILASLPVDLGGEGGIRIGEDTATERAPRITIEMRKERGARPVSSRLARIVGGQEQRGSFRGGRGGRGRGEGPHGGASLTAT